MAIDSQCDADAEWPGMMRGEEDEREGVWKGRERMKKGERERDWKAVGLIFYSNFLETCKLAWHSGKWNILSKEPEFQVQPYYKFTVWHRSKLLLLLGGQFPYLFKKQREQGPTV